MKLRENAIMAEELKKKKNKDPFFSLTPCTHPLKTWFGNPYKLVRITKNVCQKCRSLVKISDFSPFNSSVLENVDYILFNITCF